MSGRTNGLSADERRKRNSLATSATGLFQILKFQVEGRGEIAFRVCLSPTVFARVGNTGQRVSFARSNLSLFFIVYRSYRHCHYPWFVTEFRASLPCEQSFLPLEKCAGREETLRARETARRVAFHYPTAFTQRLTFEHAHQHPALSLKKLVPIPPEIHRSQRLLHRQPDPAGNPGLPQERRLPSLGQRASERLVQLPGNRHTAGSRAAPRSRAGWSPYLVY